MSNKVITGKVRASFVHVFEPQSVNGSEPKYARSFIIPKTDAETVGAIQAAIEGSMVKYRTESKAVTAWKFWQQDGQLSDWLS